MHDDFACTATGDSFCQYNFLKIHVEVALIDICREYGLDVQAPTLDGRSQKSVAVVAVGVDGFSWQFVGFLYFYIFCNYL